MELRPPAKRAFQYNSHPFSFVLLGLSTIFPQHTYAQLTTTTPTPTTFTTSATPTTQSSSTSPPADTAQPTPPPNGRTNNRSNHVFNYYFVIIALVVIAITLLALIVARRRKQKALALRNNGQTALAHDVQSFSQFRQRFGPRRAGTGFLGMTTVGAASRQIIHRHRQEGLDERGEAPPAYVEGDKPPSLRSEDISHHDASSSVPAIVVVNAQTRGSTEHASPRSMNAEDPANVEGYAGLGPLTIPTAVALRPDQDVEMGPISRSTTPTERPSLGPPTYSETLELIRTETELTRPVSAITTHTAERYNSMRGLMSESRPSSLG